VFYRSIKYPYSCFNLYALELVPIFLLCDKTRVPMFYFLNNVRLYKDVRNVNLITSNCFQYEVYQIRLKQFARLTNLIDSFMILVEARQLR